MSATKSAEQLNARLPDRWRAQIKLLSTRDGRSPVACDRAWVRRDLESPTGDVGKVVRVVKAALLAVAALTALATANAEAQEDPFEECTNRLGGHVDGQGNREAAFGMSPCRFTAWVEWSGVDRLEAGGGHLAMRCGRFEAVGTAYRIRRAWEEVFLLEEDASCVAYGVGLPDHVKWRVILWGARTNPCPVYGCTVMDLGPPPGCVSETDRVCLAGGYAVAVDYMDSAGNWVRGAPQTKLSESAAVFYFFDPDNAEVLVKLLDACNLTGHRWLYSAPATDLAYRVTVYTPFEGIPHEWIANAGGRAADTRFTSVWAITDTEAFRCSEEP